MCIVHETTILNFMLVIINVCYLTLKINELYYEFIKQCKMYS